MMMGPAIVLQFIYYRPPGFKQLHGNTRTIMQEVKRVDWVGAFLLVTGLALFLLGVSWGPSSLPPFWYILLIYTLGGSPLPWKSARILGLVISGGLVLVSFVFWGRLLSSSYVEASYANISKRFTRLCPTLLCR